MMKKIKQIDKFSRRLPMCIIGVLLSGIAVGFFKRAIFGVDPFQALMSGLDAVIPISFGTLYVIVNILLLLFSLICDRHRIGLATFINLFLLGYVVQFSRYLLETLFPELGLPGRIVCLIIGVALACVAASLYFTADLGVSTYDAIALTITETWHIGQFRFVRIVTDLVCVGLGVILYLLSGGETSGLLSIAGLGTLISALFTGPMIDLLNRKLSQPLLNK